jgi:hypothetical protein
MKKQFMMVLFHVFILFIFGCKQKEQSTENKTTNSSPFETVTVDLSSVKSTTSPLSLSMFAESIEYIQLDDNPIINDIDNSPVRVTDNYLFVDCDQIFKYNHNGKFIQSLFISGGGPSEAKKNRSSPAAFNYEKEYCTFPNFGFSYKTYSFSGEYLGEEFVADSLYKHISAYFRNNQIFYLQKHSAFKKGEELNILGPVLFYAKDMESNAVTYSYSNPSSHEKGTYRGFRVEVGDEMFFMNIDSLLWFRHRAIDTLYVTSDLKQIYPKYVFNLNDSFIDLPAYIRMRVGDMDVAEHNRLLFLGGVIPLPNDKILFTVNNQIGFFDGAKASNYTEKPIVNDLDQYLKTIDLAPFLDRNTFSLHKGYLYVMVDAYLFFENGSQSPFPTLTEESNPVVLKIKLKNT